MSFAPNFLAVKYNYSDVDAGRITSLIGLSSTVLSPIFGWLLDKHGRHAFVVSVGTLLMGVLFLLLNLHANYAILSIAGIGVCYSVVQAAIWPCMVAILDNEYFGTAYGLTTALINLGLVFANWELGYVLQHHTDTAVFVWGSLSGLAFILSVIWNIVDTTTGGISNAPADETDEEVDEEDEEQPLILNA